LILGSGSGNDVACALASKAKHIDAVEIDPVISHLGRIKHPDHPYLDPRVTLYNEDARTFLRYTKNKYDLVVFGFVDPGCTIRSSSFLRVDHYVYTIESIESVLKCLNPNGLAAILYAPDAKDHITARLYNTIKQACGADPLTFANNKGYTILFFGPGTYNVHTVMRNYPEIRRWSMPADLATIRPCTDQWPFLYTSLNYGGITLYLGTLLAVVAFPGIFIFYIQRKSAQLADTGNMFFLGLAFMLIETKSIVELSLLFGATWLVSSAVITMILVLAFLGNLIVQKVKAIPLTYLYFALLGSFAIQYFLSIPNKTDWPPVAVAILATLIACLPILFSSMIFSYCFRQSEHPSSFLAANLLGVAFGGLTENLSLLFGIKGLVPIAVVIYCFSAICLSKSKSQLLFNKSIRT